jgi:hypothetical protein
MSILSDFIDAVAPIAREVIGSETISIGGGAAISGTFNEARHSRDYEDGGFERDATMDFVVGSSAFVTAYPLAGSEYLGKAATARGDSWRVSSISKGAFFVTIGLVSTNKSA